MQFFFNYYGVTKMLRTYEATLNHGQVQWLYDQPNIEIENARIIVTIIEEFKPRNHRQQTNYECKQGCKYDVH